MYRHGINARKPYGHAHPPVPVKSSPHAVPERPASAPDRCHVVKYGPERRLQGRKERDRKFMPKEVRDVHVAQDMAKKKGGKREKEEKRLSPKEAEKLKALTVKDIDLHIRANAFAHRTGKYAITKTNYENPQAVLRRGQEFKVTVTFNRSYNKDKDDLIFIFDADEDTPGKKLKARFKLTEDGTSPYKKEGQWGATIVKEEGGKQKLELSVYIPGDAAIAEWDVKVKTDTEGEEAKMCYEHPSPIIVLFNPWSEADQVHFTDDKKLLNEYILNPSGSVYRGCAGSIGSSPWTYGQFDGGMLKTCLTILRKAFDFRMTPRMGDPVMVTRALSRIVNACDDSGVLVGNWSGKYDGGTRPTAWSSSRRILQQYEKDGEPVKYGQCWVFSHVLTAVCRALGLPCRSVTNFDSAHDTDNTCTIDHFFNEDGEELTDMKKDSIWNFHVWNEVWILRPDYPDVDCHGWHVIDATPQEQSLGEYQCGPCPVKAVKRGDVNVPFDTAFVFGEVNADVVHWVVGPDGDIITHSCIRQRNVGHRISTKYPDGKPHTKSLNRSNFRDPELRLDLTDTYKFPERSSAEREAVQRATGFLRHGNKLQQGQPNLDVRFDEDQQPMVGDDVVLTSYVENVTEEDREVSTVMAVRTCRYWNRSADDKHLAKEKFPSKLIKAGCEESFTITVPAADYQGSCDESLSMFGYVCATDVSARMPYSCHLPFRLRLPDLEVKGPSSAKSLEVVTVEVSFTNSGALTLTDCEFSMDGILQVADDDTNDFAYEPFLWGLGSWTKRTGTVKPGETFALKIRLQGELLEEDEEEETLSNDMVFSCAQIKAGIKGCVSLTLGSASQ